MELDVVEMTESIFMLSFSKQRHRVPIPSDGNNEEHRNRRQDRIVITQIFDQKTVTASRNK